MKIKDEDLEKHGLSPLPTLGKKRKYTVTDKVKARLDKQVAQVKEAAHDRKILNEQGHGVVRLEELKKKEELQQQLLRNSERIVFTPNVGPQTDFLAASEREVLYGGAAGGGKTMSMIVDPLRFCSDPNHRGILFRRTNDELRDIILSTKQLYPQAFPGAKFSDKSMTWTFSSGATIWFTYLDRDDDVMRYVGQAFNWIGFDELTQWPTDYPYNYMRSRLRSSTGLPLFMRAACNPGGPGHNWVKKTFVDPAPPNTKFAATDTSTGEVLKGKDGNPLFYRRFIPAKLHDNPYLASDGQYESNLLSLPEVQRKQLLEGSWDIVAGAAFPEFNRNIHVVKPFELPNSCVRIIGMDWGYSTPGCILWGTYLPSGQLVIYREMYFSKMTEEEVAYKARTLMQGERIHKGVADASMWQRRGGAPSHAEKLIAAGLRLSPSDRSRTENKTSRQSGKLAVHYALKRNQMNDEPNMVIFDTCVNLIRTLPTLPMDKTNVEDIDTDAEDHAYDALRYLLQSRSKPFDRAGFYSGFTDAPIFRPADVTFGY